jgi:hypothetical protein
LAVVALGLLAGEHVMPSLHHVLVAHQMCAEHGRLEHVDAESRAVAQHEEGQQFTADAARGEHQEACGSIPASPPRAPLAASSTFVGGTTAPLRSPAARYRDAVSDADVVAFAPKQSPPA